MSDAALFFRPWPARHDGRRNSSSRTELSPHLGPHRLGPLHDVFENLIHHIFLKDSQVAIALQIFLQRLQFEAMLVGHVADVQYAKIGQPGLRTHRSELGIVHHDLVSRKLIRPSLDLGKLRVESSGGVLRSVAWYLGHIYLLYRLRRRNSGRRVRTLMNPARRFSALPCSHRFLPRIKSSTVPGRLPSTDLGLSDGKVLRTVIPAAA